MSMFDDDSLRFLVMLDGVKIKFNQIQIKENHQMPSSGQIKVPPHPILNKMPPKALIHIFYREFESGGEDSKRESQRGWKMLYEGEITGVGTNRTAGSVNQVLTFKGLSSWLQSTNGAEIGVSQMFGANSNTLRLAGAQAGGFSIKNSKADVKYQTSWHNDIIEADNVPAGVDKILDDMVNNNIVLKDANKRLKLLRRVPKVRSKNHINKETFSSLLKIEDVKKLIKKNVGRIKNRKPLINYLQTALAPIMHEVSFNSSVVTGWMPRPMVRFGSPPSCNVFEPKMFNNNSFNHNFMQETTRTVVQKKVGDSPSTIYPWPDDLDWESFLEVATGGMDVDDLGDERNKVATPHEMLKGIIPAMKDYSHAKVKAASQGTEVDTYFYKQMARHEHQVNKLNTSSFSFSGGFNPEPVPGFTMMLGDPTFDVVFGLLSSVSHTIRAEGAVQTSYRVNLGRKLLSNPRNISPPTINPLIADSLSDDRDEGNLGDFYDDLINGDFPGSKQNDDIKVKTGPIHKDLVEKWHDKENVADNPVVNRGITHMKRIMNKNRTYDKGFHRRGHMTPKQLYVDFYEAKEFEGEVPNKIGRAIKDGVSDEAINTFPIFLKSKHDDVQSLLVKRRQVIEKYAHFVGTMSGSQAQQGLWPDDMDPEKLP